MTAYKAIIIDDEPLVRLAFREYIATVSSDINLVAEAGDGLEALELLRCRDDIDILFADIQMPRMNGLELLTAMREAAMASDPLVVMLSAYGDYSFVREAFVLGAFDYMLKANLDEAYLAPVLNKITSELKRRHNTPTRNPSEEEARGEETCAALHRLCALELPLEEDKELVRIRMGETNQSVAIIRFASGIDSERTQKLIIQTIRSVTDIREKECLSHVCRSDERHYTLFFSCPGQISAMTVRSIIHGMLTDILIRIQQFLNLSFSIGVSDSGNGAASWNKLRRQAEKLSALAYYEGYGRLFYPESQKPLSAIATLSEEQWKKTWTACKASVVQALSVPEDSVWREKLHVCIDKLIARYPFSPDVISAAAGELIWEWGSLLYRQDLAWDQVQGAGANPSIHPAEYVRSLDTAADVMQWLTLLAERLRNALAPKVSEEGSWRSPPVAKAKALIDKHYSEEVHLSTISEMVGVSESYLSKQFAKEIGSNFIQYLTLLRINKAKEALQAGHKIYEVSEQVGYVNTEHFSRIFKKVTGVSPKSYQKENG